MIKNIRGIILLIVFCLTYYIIDKFIYNIDLVSFCICIISIALFSSVVQIGNNIDKKNNNKNHTEIIKKEVGYYILVKSNNMSREYYTGKTKESIKNFINRLNDNETFFIDVGNELYNVNNIEYITSYDENYNKINLNKLMQDKCNDFKETKVIRIIKDEE